MCYVSWRYYGCGFNAKEIHFSGHNWPWAYWRNPDGIGQSNWTMKKYFYVIYWIKMDSLLNSSYFRVAQRANFWFKRYFHTFFNFITFITLVPHPFIINYFNFRTHLTLSLLTKSLWDWLVKLVSVRIMFCVLMWEICFSGPWNSPGEIWLQLILWGAGITACQTTMKWESAMACQKSTRGKTSIPNCSKNRRKFLTGWEDSTETW